MVTKEPSISPAILPSFIERMYAQAVRELPDGDAWAYEAKLDGYRCVAARRSAGVVLWSRRGNRKSITFKYAL
jgi:ATP-dependent DNA ligase